MGGRVITIDPVAATLGEIELGRVMARWRRIGRPQARLVELYRFAQRHPHPAINASKAIGASGWTEQKQGYHKTFPRAAFLGS